MSTQKFKRNLNGFPPFIMKVVCLIRHKPLHSFFHIKRLQFLFWPFEHPESMRRKWIEICKVLFILFLQTFYSNLPIGFPATICTSITALKFFRLIILQGRNEIFLYSWYRNDRNLFLYIKYANNALNAWILCWILKICIEQMTRIYIDAVSYFFRIALPCENGSLAY